MTQLACWLSFREPPSCVHPAHDVHGILRDGTEQYCIPTLCDRLRLRWGIRSCLRLNFLRSKAVIRGRSPIDRIRTIGGTRLVGPGTHSWQSMVILPMTALANDPTLASTTIGVDSLRRDGIRSTGGSLGGADTGCDAARRGRIRSSTSWRRSRKRRGVRVSSILEHSETIETMFSRIEVMILLPRQDLPGYALMKTYLETVHLPIAFSASSSHGADKRPVPLFCLFKC